MKNRKLYFFSYIFLWLIFGTILISAQTPTPQNSAETQMGETLVAEENLIHSGDLIDVDVVGSFEYDWRGVLSAEGFLNIGYNQEPIYGLCRNEEAIAAAVAKAYEKILREPKVTVKILDRSNRPISTLFGAVKMPQRFRINRPVFLNELIIDSGGFTEKVSGEIQIFRPKNLNCLNEIKARTILSDGNREKVEQEKSEKNTAASDINSEYFSIKIADLLLGKKESNPQILSGDVITVLEARAVYVIGGVVNPKQVLLRSQITLSRAIASAGGLSKDAVARNVTIFRRDRRDTKIIEADLDKVKINPAEDLTLQAFDVIEVAQRGRVKRKYPPIVKSDDASEKNAADLPLRIID